MSSKISLIFWINSVLPGRALSEALVGGVVPKATSYPIALIPNLWVSKVNEDVSSFDVL
jgi:hypothetical protein